MSLPGEEFECLFRQLTKNELLSALDDCQFSPSETYTRETLHEAALQNPASQALLQEAVGRKRRRVEYESEQTMKRMRLDSQDGVPGEEQFLADVGENVRRQCIVDFINATGNEALSSCACVTCGGEFFVRETCEFRLADLPNQHLLRPGIPHPRQQLICGLLLYNAGVYNLGDGQYGRVCTSCQYYLRSKKPSPYFLINNLWLGDVPAELAILTLAERVLIARFYPAAYIVKLYPKRRGASHFDIETLNSGLRGNVSTYHLNTQDVVHMVQGRFLPPPPSLLAATIGVTIVGPRNVPERSLPSLLTVSRNRVRNALQFLVRENPLYEDIVISEERLNLLPECGVPEELKAVIHVCEDSSPLEEEHDSYVNDELSTPIDNTVPATIPIQSYGVLDPSVSELDDQQVLTHALVNAAGTPLVDETYAVRRGGSFISEYPRRDEEGALSIGNPENPNHLLGAFPCLFPYGVGAFEVSRPIPVSYEAHAKWALRYADRRFRTDLRFVFQVFGVIQKRQVCRSAVMQIRKKDFVRNMSAFHRMTPSDLLAASEEEGRHQHHSNPVVSSLKRHISAVRSHVIGTDESRIKIRSLVWGMVMKKNPPSLWITINPSDTQNPIAQVLTGADIDLDRFERTSGPDSHQRAVRIAQDPYAAAKYFHFMVNTILEVLFGLKCVEGSVDRRTGVFGKVEGYIGTVEAQGRGTLHLHMLLWLRGAPTASRMNTLLSSDSFRARVAAFVSTNIRAASHGSLSVDIPLPDDSSISYARPVDPRIRDYERIQRTVEEKLANILQVHKCGPACTIVVKGKLTCKRHAPFPVASAAWVDAQGCWGPRRENSMMNNFCPMVLNTVLCNNDVKLITNGDETKDISFYFTNYTTKNQQHSFNASALLARTLAYHQAAPNAPSNVDDLNKKLIQRCANSLSRDQEFSAPEVMSYVMGWGDRYISHHFEPLYISTVLSLLKERYPTLREHIPTSHGSGNAEDPTSIESLEQFSQRREDDPEYVILEVRDGNLQLRDRVKDYVERGDLLENYSFFDFFLNTYDAPRLTQLQEAELPLRHRNIRVQYRPERDKRCRIIRNEQHEVMPYFPGRWFPRASGDDRESESLYHAATLALFKPWREITDVKPSEVSFRQAYDNFMSDASPGIRQVVENIQYFYSCSDKARQRSEQNANLTAWAFPSRQPEDEPDDEEGEETPVSLAHGARITEDDIEDASRSVFSARELLYADLAIDAAERHEFFTTSSDLSGTGKGARDGEEDDVRQYHAWMEILRQPDKGSSEDAMRDEGDVNMAPLGQWQPAVLPHFEVESSDDEIDVLYGTLNDDQFMAFRIIENNILLQLRGVSPPQVLMYVGGHGGVGKTFLIDAIEDLFIRHGIVQSLAKTATTGVAASNIGGSTIHSWAGLPACNPRSDTWAIHPNTQMATRRRNNIAGKRLFVMDEISMLTTDTLADLSKVTSIVLGNETCTLPLGGLNTMATGDFHQLPPVAKFLRALFQSQQPTTKSRLGRELWLQFDTVILLEKQMRIEDGVWSGILDRARIGECTKHDLETIRHLTLGNPKCTAPDFSSTPWCDAVLVTPRNSVRVRWNELALRKHCARSGNIEYRCASENTTKDGGLTMLQRWTIAQMPVEDTGDLEMSLAIAIGAPVMITENICPIAGLANGTRGEIKDIILDPREHREVANPSRLKYPPLCVVIELPSSSKNRFKFRSLPPRQLPVYPVTHNFYIGSKPRVRVTRRQLPLTLAYAFTDFKSQGQTLPYTVVDIGKTTSFTLSPFNAYVALSRSRGRQNIRLLRDFEDSLFTRHPSEALREEDARLHELAKQTKERFLRGEYGPISRNERV